MVCDRPVFSMGFCCWIFPDVSRGALSDGCDGGCRVGSWDSICNWMAASVNRAETLVFWGRPRHRISAPGLDNDGQISHVHKILMAKTCRSQKNALSLRQINANKK